MFECLFTLLYWFKSVKFIIVWATSTQAGIITETWEPGCHKIFVIIAAFITIYVKLGRAGTKLIFSIISESIHILLLCLKPRTPCTARARSMHTLYMLPLSEPGPCMMLFRSDFKIWVIKTFSKLKNILIKIWAFFQTNICLPKGPYFCFWAVLAFFSHSVIIAR